MSTSPKIISMGRRCNATEFLKKFNLYSEASPLDWNVCDFETIIHLLNTDFKNYADNIYEIWKKKIVATVIPPYDSSKISAPTLQQVSYLKIQVKNHKNLAMNLNFDNRQNPQTLDMYRDAGLYYFHYDMSLPQNIETMKRRVDRFLDYDPEEIILFHIWNIVSGKDLDIIKDYALQFINTTKYRFIIVLPYSKNSTIQNSKSVTSEIIHQTDSSQTTHLFIYLPVPSLQEQLTEGLAGKPPVGNENNINDPRIDWRKVYDCIKYFMKHK